ncbi:hypothetical protein AX14_014280, partial [Amanita brunnescens Koide BX004]
QLARKTPSPSSDSGRILICVNAIDSSNLGYRLIYIATMPRTSVHVHENTTLDMAKFEVCGRKYADLSEFRYGVAFLSESKYGFHVLCISLLRAATAPYAEQDQGGHQFSWAILPHEGHFLKSDVPMAAYLLILPPKQPLFIRHTLEYFCFPCGESDTGKECVYICTTGCSRVGDEYHSDDERACLSAAQMYRRIDMLPEALARNTRNTLPISCSQSLMSQAAFYSAL